MKGVGVVCLSERLARPPMMDGDDCVADDIGDMDCDASALGEDGIVRQAHPSRAAGAG
jgi:hypothetical protein